MWASHRDCYKIISESWSSPVRGCPMFILSQKLNNLKANTKAWNKDEFGHVNRNVEKTVMNLESVQAQMSDGTTDELSAQEQLAQLELNKARLSISKKITGKEKSRVNWHCFGDRNTTFFHRLTKVRHAKNGISVLKSGNLIFD